MLSLSLTELDAAKVAFWSNLVIAAESSLSLSSKSPKLAAEFLGLRETWPLLRTVVWFCIGELVSSGKSVKGIKFDLDDLCNSSSRFLVASFWTMSIKEPRLSCSRMITGYCCLYSSSLPARLVDSLRGPVEDTRERITLPRLYCWEFLPAELASS